MPILSIPIRTHGRVVVDGDEPTGKLLVIFHGYAQSAEDALTDAREIPGVDAWRIAAVQGCTGSTRGATNASSPVG